jgi:hypothetical protein
MVSDLLIDNFDSKSTRKNVPGSEKKEAIYEIIGLTPCLLGKGPMTAGEAGEDSGGGVYCRGVK